MQDSQQSRVRGPVRPPRRARWLLRGVLAIPVLFAVAAAIVWWTQGRTVAHKIQSIRERGEPVTAAELEAFYETPPHDEDATRLWTTASSYLSQAGGTQLARQLPFMGDAPEPPPPGQPWKELPLAEQFLKDNAAAMKMLHDAARTGGTARYSTDFSQGFMMLLPDVQNARQSMRCLLLETHVRAHRGDAAGAADSLRTGLALARSMEKEPILVSLLVRIAVNGIVNTQLKELLPTTEFSDDDLVRLQDELLTIDFQPALRRSMLGERVMGIMAFDDPSGLGMTGAAALAARVVSHGDLTSYLSVMEDYAAAADQPWPAPLADTKEVSREFLQHVGRFNILTKQLVPAIDATADAAARGTAQSRVMALAIALERYRRANGKPPLALDELAPKYIKQVPLDPHTGKAFNYQLSDTGYVVYTLGGIKAGRDIDTETGASELLLFRWPPKPKPAPVDDAAPMGEM